MANILDKVADVTSKTTEIIDKTSAGNLGAVTQTQAWQQFTFWFYIIVGVAIMFALFVVLYKFYLRYNKIVLIKQLKGSAVIDAFKTRGRIYTDKNNRLKLELLKPRGKSCPVPSYKYTSKMGKLDFYEGFLDDDGNLKLKLDTDIQFLEDSIKSREVISQQELSGWRLQDLKSDEERFKSKNFLQKHGGLILTFAGMLAVTVMVWIAMKQIGAGMKGIGAGLLELAKSIQSLR